MFRVRHKTTGLKHTVYAVSGIRFLIWVDLPQGEEHWTWVDMGECMPLKRASDDFTAKLRVLPPETVEVYTLGNWDNTSHKK